jgi:integrase
MIAVKVRKKPDRECYQLYYVCPLTGMDRTKSSNTVYLKEAEREAQKWETELNDNGVDGGPISWPAFRIRFEDEHLRLKKTKTQRAYNTALNHFESIVGKPLRIADITSSVLSKFASGISKITSSPSSEGCYLRHVKSALGWARKIGLINRVPVVSMPRNSTGNSKGRALTDDEFQLFLEATKIARPNDYKIWQHFIRGLRLCGLRVQDAARLSWDADAAICVDLNGGEYPQFRFTDGSHKGNDARLIPMMPDCFDFLNKTPIQDRVGRVFKIPYPKQASDDIREIGEASGIVVSKTGKFASAHDLKRTFLTYWSKYLMPAELMLIGMHKDIKTTIAYYVNQKADDVSRKAWGNRVPPNVPQKSKKRKKTQNVTIKRIVKTSVA